MKKIVFFLLNLILLISCQNQKQKSNEIIIEGNVKKIPNGKVYLTEAHYWNIFLDSAICKDGYFKFVIKADSNFFPYMASICFTDSSSPIKTTQLMYANEFNIQQDTSKFRYTHNSGFYLEKGFTQITGEVVKHEFENGIPVKIEAGKETEVYYKNERDDIGWIGNIDSSKRLLRIAYFKKLIREYSFSYFLLQSIYYAKEQYSKKEMNDILSLFNEDVQQSKLGDKIRTYLVNRPDPNTPYANLFLLNSANQRQYIIDTTAKLNMLVFWASWCGPCRLEIPLLKEIQKKYAGKGLSLVSISTDENRAFWEKALQQEKMNWLQYIVDKEKIETVRQQYNFSAIPLVLFVDRSGKEIAKINGYYEENKKNYESIISKFIK